MYPISLKLHPISLKSNQTLPVPKWTKKTTLESILAVSWPYNFRHSRKIMALSFLRRSHFMATMFWFFFSSHKRLRLQRKGKPSCDMSHCLFYSHFKGNLMIHFPSVWITRWFFQLFPQNTSCQFSLEITVKLWNMKYQSHFFQVYSKKQCANWQGRWWASLLYSLLVVINDAIYASELKFLQSACKQWNAPQTKDSFRFLLPGFIVY